MKYLISTLAIVFYTTSVYASPVTVTSPHELELARSVSNALSDVTSRVTQCVNEAKKDIEACRCENQAAIAKLEHAYLEAQAVNPLWSDKTLNFAPAEGSDATTALNFKMLPQAIATACAN